MKVKIFDQTLLKNVFSPWIAIVSFISGLFGFVDLPLAERVWIFVLLMGLVIIYYFYCLYKANKMTEIDLDYDGTTIEIKQGNILSEQYKRENIIRVFNFNEYFDTEIDQELVSEKTLNGQILNKEFKDKIPVLNSKMEDDNHLQRNVVETNVERIKGKTTRYNLGTIFLQIKTPSLRP